MTRTIEGTASAWLTEYQGPEVLSSPNIGAKITLFDDDLDMSKHGYTRIGTARVIFTVVDEKSIVENKVDSLKAQQTSILAEAQAKHTELERKIQTLLAISFDAPANDSPDDQPGYGVDAAGTFEG